MAQLTQDRSTLQGIGDVREFPVAAGATIYAGGVVEVLANGTVTPYVAGSGKTIVGVNNEKTYDNSGGVDGAITARVQRGEWGMNNSPGGEEITNEHIGQDAFLVDDNTVQLTVGGGLTPAGKVFHVRGSQVYVTFL